MNMRKLMLMGGALMLAAFCAVTARSLFGSGQQASATVVPGLARAPTGPEVLVATRTLPVGTIVTADAFRYQPWPKDLIQQAYFIKGQQAPLAPTGSVVRYAVTAGQPVTQGSLVQPGDRGFLAAALGPGMRAVTVAVTAQAGVAGFVFPGDRIDLLLTSSVSGGGGGGSDQPLRTSETIVRNLRVLATDQRTEGTDASGKSVVTAFSNVTLETTPKLAEKIAVAQTIGTLSLSLRSIADNGLELEREIAAGEVSLPDGADPKAERALRLQVAARPIDSDPTLTTGAEVSRFQRSTPPQVASTSPSPMGVPMPNPQGSGAPSRSFGVQVIRGGSTNSAPTSSPQGGM